MPVCIARGLKHRYDDHIALGSRDLGSKDLGSRDQDDGGVDLDVSAGEIVALLGPNGSGKTTLFRILCTLLPIQDGTLSIAGIDAATDPLSVRGQIGIVFQSASLDAKLTVDENLACQGALYGLRGEALKQRRDECLASLGLTDRRSDFCGKLSGGLKRRVEVAKGMLHRPKLLLLDEPSTGLDPSARLELWSAIESLAREGVAVLMTTHLLEEAEKANRVVILSDGRKIAEGTPSELRSELGDGVVTVTAQENSGVETILAEQMKLDIQKVHGEYRIKTDSPVTLIPALIETLGDRAESISIGKPSLEDVFVSRTGQRFES